VITIPISRDKRIALSEMPCHKSECPFLNEFQKAILYGNSQSSPLFCGCIRLAVTQFFRKPSSSFYTRRYAQYMPFFGPVMQRSLFPKRYAVQSFWPGSQRICSQRAVFYAYAYPSDAVLKNTRYSPEEAFLSA